jgi:putative phosphoesterase
MKIALMSDSHDNWSNLQKAVDIANKQGCEHLVFAGDLISPPGLKVLEKFSGEVHTVLGNNEGEVEWYVKFVGDRDNVTLYGNCAELEFGGKKIYLQHYPRAAEIAAQSNLFDICVYGHNHQYSVGKLGNTLLLNPGTVHGYKHINRVEATCMILDLSNMKVEKVVL